MTKVSVLIPSRNEPFLQQTITDLLTNARGDVEIVAVCDGYWPDPALTDDKRLIVLHHGEPCGMRQSINAAAQVATGDYLMKIDAHCAVGEGWDVTLAADCDDDWVVVPLRKRLDPVAWAPVDVGKPDVTAHYLSNPLEKKNGQLRVLTDSACGLHGTIWTDRILRTRHEEMADEMSSQGSCWFTSRRCWDERIGPLDHGLFESFFDEFIEVGNRVWLSGGAVRTNRKTFVSHWHKGKPRQLPDGRTIGGRGYRLSGPKMANALRYSDKFWMLGSWGDNWVAKKQHELQWLIERFAPVPTWPNDDIGQVFAEAKEFYRDR